MAGGTPPALPPPAAQGFPSMVGRVTYSDPPAQGAQSLPTPRLAQPPRHTIPAWRDPLKARASAVCKAPGDSLQSEVCSLKANYEILFRVQPWGAFPFYLH